MLILGLSFALSFAVHADSLKYVCQKIGAANKPGNTTVVVQQIEDGKLTEGTPKRFSLETFKDSMTSAELSTEGNVETEDVNFDYTSDDGKVTFHIYLDELDQSALSIDGKDQGRFVCR
jgi:hypothetical protein